MEFEVQTRKSEQINLIPMVSIIFLLLIFFLAAGTIRSPTFWDIKPPVSTSQEKIDSKNIQIYLNQNGQIAFEKQMITNADLLKMLQDNNEVNINLQVHADKRVNSGSVIKLINTLDKSLVNQLILVTTSQNS